ncbi:MAG: class II aldolase/adducin family protein [Syntrophomonadaceae bacterium]
MRFGPERKMVVDTAREISRAGLVIGTWGNVSLKIAEQPLVLITPSGMDYRSMEAEDIVLVDMEGQQVEGSWKPSSELPLHLAVYRRRPDLLAIVHVHSSFATAFAVARQTIPVIMEETAQVIGHPIQTAPYALAGSRRVAELAADTLGMGKAVLLANHGLVGTGKNLQEALRVCQIAEETARETYLARMLGGAYALTPEEIDTLHQGYLKYGQTKPSSK